MSPCAVYVTPEVLREIKALPGHVRQRVKRAIDDLESDPQPGDSKELDLSALDLPTEETWQVYRLRIDQWRILYAVSENEKIVDVLAVRKRPPYDYGDLEDLLGELEP